MVMVGSGARELSSSFFNPFLEQERAMEKKTRLAISTCWI
jgi:hypothetical protein